MRLADLLEALRAPAGPGPGPVVLGSLERDVTGLAYHSERVAPGDLFAAVRGFAHDGHAFVPDAVRRGAVAVLVERPLGDLAATQIVVPDTRRALALCAAAFYGHPSRSLWLCGVTGTKGKTTTTYCIDAVLRGAGRTSAVIGTIGVRAGGELLDFHATTPTTPEAPDLQGLLRDLRARGVDNVTMEITSHALELGRVEGCRIMGAVYTNLTHDHLDLHGDVAHYREAKRRLFAAVDPGGVSVVNADDPHADVMAAASRAPVWTYGIERPAMVRAEAIEPVRLSDHFIAVWPGGRLPVTLPLPGRFNISNALAALAVGLARGLDPEQMREGLEAMPAPPGRFEPVDEGQPFVVIVDYAHTPDSLEKVLRLAAEIGPGRRIVVFGCGGDRDRTKRPIMGRIGTTLADYAIFTSDNPRGEDPAAILTEIEAGARGAANFETEVDRRRAIGRALALARPGDIVVIAGKGHETYQIIGDQVIAFDDREVAREFLRAAAAGRAACTRPGGSAADDHAGGRPA